MDPRRGKKKRVEAPQQQNETTVDTIQKREEDHPLKKRVID